MEPLEYGQHYVLCFHFITCIFLKREISHKALFFEKHSVKVRLTHLGERYYEVNEAEIIGQQNPISFSQLLCADNSK